MEACGSAHHWGRLIAGFGHTLRLAPPIYAKQGVKRHKSDAADAAAIEAVAPSLESFRRGRDFATWLGLVPKQHSTGGKERLGRLSKTGQRDFRKLLISGAMALIRCEIRKGDDANPWIARLIARKPRLVAAVVLANIPLTHASICCRAVDGTHHLGHGHSETDLPNSGGGMIV